MSSFSENDPPYGVPYGTSPGSLYGPTQPMPAIAIRDETTAPLPIAFPRKPRSFQLTGWALVDNALELVDRRTKGKAGLLQRLVSYLIVGGFAALVNLVVFYVAYYHIRLPFDDHIRVQHALRYLICFTAAAEISTMTNFLINDFVTFRHLAGHSRRWIARCGRFHLTSLGGTLVTLAISYGLAAAGLHALVAEAVAICVAVAFNFTFHHLFTYRHARHAPAR